MPFPPQDPTEAVYPADGSTTDPAASTPMSKADVKNAEIDGSEIALPKIVRFGDLARCGDEVWIEHENQLYRLRRTRQGKLILTK